MVMHVNYMFKDISLLYYTIKTVKNKCWRFVNLVGYINSGHPSKCIYCDLKGKMNRYIKSPIGMDLQLSIVV
jgi:hypothetical protein